MTVVYMLFLGSTLQFKIDERIYSWLWITHNDKRDTNIRQIDFTIDFLDTIDCCGNIYVYYFHSIITIKALLKLLDV